MATYRIRTNLDNGNFIDTDKIYNDEIAGEMFLIYLARAEEPNVSSVELIRDGKVFLSSDN